MRTLRQESERIKEMYESKKVQSPDSLKVIELEKELETTKIYFNKRIREIEEKTKYRVPSDKDKKSVTVIADVKSLEEKIDKLTKERNILA